MPTVARSLPIAFSVITLLGGCKPRPTVSPSPSQSLAPARPITASPPQPAAAPSVAASTQPATVLRSATASVDQILAGRKTSTTRKGVRTYPLGPAVTTDGKRRVPIVITGIDAKRFDQLTAADAASDGSASLAAYRSALVHSYPGLTDADGVSVVHFRVVGPVQPGR